MNPTTLMEWQQLSKHAQKIKKISIQKMFEEDKHRAKTFLYEPPNYLIDLSKNLMTKETIPLLINLARKMNLVGEIGKMFSGERINKTEDRSVLHTVLRNLSGESLVVDGVDVQNLVDTEVERMTRFAEGVHNGEFRGYTDKRIRTIINIGIGGSNLGPLMVYEALKNYAVSDMEVRFISNIDGAHFVETTKDLDPETTLFIISSKSFTTQETMVNAFTARKWLIDYYQSKDAVCHHFVAVSTNIEKVIDFGIDQDNIFQFWDWVGGRYSLTSAIGLSLMLGLGVDVFNRLRKGFYQMDQHFKNSDLDVNLPVLLGLIGIWYNNFFQAETHAIIPYDQYLKYLPAYLQQADMESNGKSVGKDNLSVDYQTGPVIWGEPGTDGQHAFFQLIHQGTKLIPCDFIGFVNPLNNLVDHHQILLANFFAQQEALAFGKSEKELVKENISPSLIPFRVFSGNRPTNCILGEKLTPESLGSLIALYEHKIFVQGVVWNIFSFDQWGVELGKQLASKILTEIKNRSINTTCHDASTNQLLQYYLKKS